MSADSGTRLRSLFEPQGGVGQIFSGKVADYTASRPGYPALLFDMLRVTGNLGPGSLVADIGSGTGLLTQGLLQRGYRVVAVEPNEAMRNAADDLLGRFPRYRSVAGFAESMPIDMASVDMVTAAQAFHWFKIDQARAECLRVLRPGGQIALIWNDRLLTDPVQLELEEIFAKYGGARRAAMLAHQERGDVPAFFGAAAPAEMSYPHEHLLSEAGLQSLAFSRSYMPDRDSAAGREAAQVVRQIFARHATAGLVTIRYTTVAVIGRPQ